MGQALYRKYRSKKLSEVVGQDHITTALDNALKQGKISHAYLFTGPRGTGKTSVARILAHELNGLPYDETATHLDIIEIDAASNRRIDEIRELRERVHNAPASAKFKVYIIDEVHMLTREAFNALLKTLEEPPEHAIFILATTEAHKLPETIISRTQRYSFRPIEVSKAVNHLKMIAKSEGITIDDDALELIAEHGEGSFRDSISLLDQIRHTDKKINLQTVQRSLGIAPQEAITSLIETAAAGGAAKVIELLKDMHQHGYHAPQMAKQLGAAFRNQLIQGQPTAIPAGQLSRLLKQLLKVPVTSDPEKYLEIVMLEAALSQSLPDTTETAVPEPKPTPAPKPSPSTKTDPVKKDLRITSQTGTPPPNSEKSPTTPEPSGKLKQHGSPLTDAAWQDVLQAIKSKHNTLYSVVRMAVPRFEGKELILTFSFPFHQKRLNESKNKQVVSDIISETTGQSVEITCLVDVNARSVPAAIAQPDVTDPAIENISNIFGGGEVLE